MRPLIEAEGRHCPPHPNQEESALAATSSNMPNIATITWQGHFRQLPTQEKSAASPVVSERHPEIGYLRQLQAVVPI